MELTTQNSPKWDLKMTPGPTAGHAACLEAAATVNDSNDKTAPLALLHSVLFSSSRDQLCFLKAKEKCIKHIKVIMCAKRGVISEVIHFLIGRFWLCFFNLCPALELNYINYFSVFKSAIRSVFVYFSRHGTYLQDKNRSIHWLDYAFEEASQPPR